MAEVMRQIVSLIILVFALFALASPSLAVAVRVSAADIVATAPQGGPRVEVNSTCLQGGARVLPCQPDIGVLASAALGAATAVPVFYAMRQDALRASTEPGLDLPPPRRG